MYTICIYIYIYISDRGGIWPRLPTHVYILHTYIYIYIYALYILCTYMSVKSSVGLSVCHSRLQPLFALDAVFSAYAVRIMSLSIASVHTQCDARRTVRHIMVYITRPARPAQTLSTNVHFRVESTHISLLIQIILLYSTEEVQTLTHLVAPTHRRTHNRYSAVFVSGRSDVWFPVESNQ